MSNECHLEYLSVVVFVEIIDTSDTTAVVIRIVDVLHVMAVIPRITGDHSFGASVDPVFGQLSVGLKCITTHYN